MKACVIFLLIITANIISQEGPWFSQNPLPQNKIYSLKFFDQNNGIGFCDNGIIIKTTNQGYTWQYSKTPPYKTLYASQFLTNTLGYAVGESGVVLKTLNGGNGWSVLNTGVLNKLNTLFFIDINTGFIAGDSGLVLKTTNAGLNWQQSVISEKKINSIIFTSAQNGFAVGDTTFLFKTTNGGISWDTQYISPQHNIFVYFVDSDIGFVRSEGKLFRTSDAGNNWEFNGVAGTNILHSSIDFVNGSTGYMVSDNSREYKTTNAGVNWDISGTTPSNIFPFFNVYCIDALDTNNIFISGNNGFIFKTSHSTDIWSHIGGNINNYYYISFTNPMTGFIHSGNYILNTTNGGEKWIINSYGWNNWFEPSWVEYKKIVSNNNGLMIRSSASGGGGGPNYGEWAYFSTDGGESWPGSLGGQYVYVSDIALADDYGVALFTSSNYTLRKTNISGTWPILYTSTTGNTLYRVSFHNNNYGVLIGKNNSSNEYTLIRTTDGGLNWSNLAPPVSNRLNEIQLLPTGTGIVICDSSLLLRTNDFSANWQVRYSGPVRFRTVGMLDDNNGYGLSTENKFIHTSDGGLNWSVHNTGSPKRLNAVCFLDINTGYIVGDSGTILKTSNGGLTFINPSFGNLPGRYSLSQNYPNPFNPVTNIRFDIPVGNGRDRLVKLFIYDLLGREITTLVNQQMQSGSYSVDWDASNYPSGVYFYKLETESISESKKMVLVK